MKMRWPLEMTIHEFMHRDGTCQKNGPNQPSEEPTKFCPSHASKYVWNCAVPFEYKITPAMAEQSFGTSQGAFLRSHGKCTLSQPGQQALVTISAQPPGTVMFVKVLRLRCHSAHVSHQPTGKSGHQCRLSQTYQFLPVASPPSSDQNEFTNR